MRSLSRPQRDLRLFHLGTQSLWYDEGYSVNLAGKGLAQITLETANDIQPPLYYYLLHLWMGLFGQGEIAVRGLSLLLGMLSVPLFYILGRRLFSREVGLIAAGLAALSPLYVWYSQEVRMYTLLVALTLGSCYFLWSALENRDDTSTPVVLGWRCSDDDPRSLRHITSLPSFWRFRLHTLFIAWLWRWHRPRPRQGLLALRRG